MSDATAEFPVCYEQIDGGQVNPKWAGRMILVPAAWVRERNRILGRAAHACLAKGMEKAHNAGLLPTLTKYVREYGTLRRTGADMVLAGRVDHQRLHWSGCAVLNEITLRYGNHADTSVKFMDMTLVAWMMDARTQNADAYAGLRNTLLRSKLLLIHTPNKMAPDAAGRWFLEAIYEERYNRKLSTITTLTTDPREDAWKHLRRVLGPTITELLAGTSADFIAHCQ